MVKNRYAVAVAPVQEERTLCGNIFLEQLVTHAAGLFRSDVSFPTLKGIWLRSDGSYPEEKSGQGATDLDKSWLTPSEKKLGGR